MSMPKRYRTLAEPFEEQASRTPDAVALVDDEQVLTYGALDRRANQLANTLRARGIGPGERVGIYMSRGADLVTAVYAIAKLGAAYVPLSPDLPEGRIATVLHDARPALVLVHDDTQALLPTEPGVEFLSVSAQATALADGDPSRPSVPAKPTHPAIVFATSGSTGRPKLVVLPAQAPLAFLVWLAQNYPLQLGESVLLKTPFVFDVSTYELFWTLYTGATLIICRPGGHRDPRYLVELIRRHKITAAVFIPSMLHAFLQVPGLDQCQSLRWVFCGGEVLTPRLRDAFHEQLAAELINLYGPTEAGAVTYFPVPRSHAAASVPIGAATACYSLYVLDDALQPVAPNELGQLYIGGDVGLASGYLGRPGKTAAEFVPDPFGKPGARMYRTGDLGHWTDTGVLEFQGRADHQVKVRGERVDCEDVAAAIENTPGVRKAVIVAHRRERGAEPRLVAYIEAVESVTEEQLVTGLRRHLTEAMIPSAFVFLDVWPLTINGKLDRKRLPSPFERTESVDLDGATSLELAVAEQWKSVVGWAPRTLDTDFFAAGGDSLLALRLINRLSALIGFELALNDFMEARTVRTLTAVLEQQFAARGGTA